MAVTIGYDGKFLWQGKNLGSRSGYGMHASRLLKEMLECCPRKQFRVYALERNSESWLTGRIAR